MNQIKVGIAQIYAHPSFNDKVLSALAEPVITDEKISLSSLELGDIGFDIRENIQTKYNKYFKKKLECILEYFNGKEIDILIFPEYTIPPEALKLLYDYSIQNNIIIVAGSHTVLKKYENIYTDIKLHGINLEITSENSDVRKSIAPIFIGESDNTQYIEKITQSSWEVHNPSGSKWDLIKFNINNRKINVAIQL
ncbi:MAG: hypothetical protein ACOCRK_09180, partial [bacterium]